ncbi:MAG: AbrB/MazE/SpoVT family DNA-binding domain-containing protein [Ignisphaera sp.]
MFSEVVKVDSKGRITIPATLRLLLNISDGEKLILVFDEDSNKIELHLSKPNRTLFCSGVISRDTLLRLLKEYNMDIISCRCRDNHCDFYHCKIFVELSKDKDEFMKNSPNIRCIE